MRVKLAGIFILSAVVCGTVFAQGTAETTFSQADSGNTLVYVPNVSGGVTEINAAGNTVFGTAPWVHGSNGGIAITPDGRRMYISNHEASSVSVFDTATNVPLTEIGVGLNPIGIALTRAGDRVYVANQNSNSVSVIATATNTVVKTIPVGAGPIWITISPDGSRAYVSNQDDSSLSIVSTASNTVVRTIPIGSLPFHSAFASDGRFLWVSAQGEDAVKILDTSTNTVVQSIPAGPNPRGIAFTPDGSRAYVADFSSNTLAVIDASTRSLAGFITVGNNPWNLAITAKGYAYVAEFGDNTVSVLDTSTNTVTVTLPARVNPVDVLITRQAQPLVLNYDFVPIAVPGAAIECIVHGLNDAGDAVGDFTDSNNVSHGFIRKRDGSLVIFDVPGSLGTDGQGINDHGVAVGDFADANGYVHGYRRDPDGTFTTINYPSATDTGALGINNLGDIAGTYDLGDQSTNIGYLLVRGQFTSFEVPGSWPQTTAVTAINDWNQISGTYRDLENTPHGFLRNPKDGSFLSLDFADSVELFTNVVQQINDLGVIAGQHKKPSPQGFLMKGSHFLAIDFPNSHRSGLLAVNNLGQIGGWFASESGVPLAYIATPRSQSFPFLAD